MAGPVWDIVRSVEISVDADAGSEARRGSLARGARVQELERLGERMRYMLLEGSGPAEGWFSVQVDGIVNAIAAGVEGDDCSMTVARELIRSPGITVQVKIEQGLCEGVVEVVWNKPVASFRNIPYAQPPCGSRRFGITQGAYSWEMVRDCRELGPCCPQFISEGVGGLKVMFDKVATLSRDSSEHGCLNVSVFTPHKAIAGSSASATFPVEVYLHGGHGWGHGSLLARREHVATADVIVVEVDYRFNLLGLLCHPELSAENGGCSGAWKYYDFLECLRWVKRNIPAFGGDPSRVILVGDSGGAALVTVTAMLPQAADLISAAVCHSTVGDCNVRYGCKAANPTFAKTFGTENEHLLGKTGEEKGVALLSWLGFENVEAVREVSWLDLWQRYCDKCGRHEYAHPDVLGFLDEIVDGDLIRAPVLQYAESSTLPIFMLSARDEALDFMHFGNKFLHEFESDDDFMVYRAKFLGRQKLTEIRKCYDILPVKSQGSLGFRHIFAEIYGGDNIFTVGSFCQAQRFSAAGARVFWLNWNYLSECGSMSLRHSMQMTYHYPTLDDSSNTFLHFEPSFDVVNHIWSSQDYCMAWQLQHMTREFFETGSPGWPQLEPKSDKMATLTLDGELLFGPRPDLVHRWGHLQKEKESLYELQKQAFGFEATKAWRVDIDDEV